ncbi:MAG: hypothetical protein ABI808_04445 [Pseudonocardiales bacterium]
MSVFFADPSELYAIADRITRHAEALRSTATTLAAAMAQDRWRGIAAEVFGAQAGSVLKDMWACARRLDDAADALRRHARWVEGVLGFAKHVWDDVEGWGEAVVGDVTGFLVGGVVVDGVLADLVARVAG